MYPRNPSQNGGVAGGRSTDSGWWNPTTSMPAIWATGSCAGEPTRAWKPFDDVPAQRPHPARPDPARPDPVRTEPERPAPPEPIEVPDLSDADDGNTQDATTENIVTPALPDPPSTGPEASESPASDIDDLLDHDFFRPDLFDPATPLDPLPAPATAYSAVFDASARPDAGKHGTIATEAIADEGMADRISGPAVNRTMRQVGFGTLIPVAAILAVTLIRDQSSTTLLLCAMVLVAAAFMLVGVVWYAPRRWRNLLSPGTRIVAEFSPSHISYGYATENVMIPMAKIVSVRADESALHLVYRQGLGTATTAIPNELVPSSVALDLTGRFGG